VVVEAYGSTPMMACEHGKQAQCVVTQLDEGQAAVAAQYALALGPLHDLRPAAVVLEVEAFVEQLVVTAYLHSS